jgi:hypothetical protein
LKSDLGLSRKWFSFSQAIEARRKMKQSQQEIRGSVASGSLKSFESIPDVESLKLLSDFFLFEDLH